MSPIFLSRIRNPAPVNEAPLPSLINLSHENQENLPGLINPAQANQAIFQMKEIVEKSTFMYFCCLGTFWCPILILKIDIIKKYTYLIFVFCFKKIRAFCLKKKIATIWKNKEFTNKFEECVSLCYREYHSVTVWQWDCLTVWECDSVTWSMTVWQAVIFTLF